MHSNSSTIYKKLESELSNIPSEKRWEHIKTRLLNESDRQRREDLESLFTFLMANNIALPKKKETLVAMVHGIRTHAEWHDQLEKAIKSSSTAEVKSVKYGFFDSIRFLMHFYGPKLKHVTEEFRLLKRDYPDHEIVIVAHSFGTFLTTKFIENNTDFNVDRVLFCGAVVNENYNFAKLPNFPGQGCVINDVGTQDIYPVLAKSCSLGYGASGTLGFNRQQIKNRYFECKHSGFFTEELFDSYWLPFLLRGDCVDSETTTNRPMMKYHISILSLMPGFILIVLLVLILIFYYLFI